MKFAITWTVHPHSYERAIGRFLETGAQPPEGVKMLGRWHALEGSGNGFIIAESSDAKAIYKWLAQWTDVVSFTVTPVVEDADAAEVLQAAQAARKS